MSELVSVAADVDPVTGEIVDSPENMELVPLNLAAIDEEQLQALLPTPGQIHGALIIARGKNAKAPAVLVEKHGGKFFVTDEARDRNDGSKIQREGRKIMNAMVRRQDARAIAIVDASIAGIGSQTITGLNWGAVVTGGSSQSNASAWPAADFAKAQLLADTQELGVEFDTWIVNPAQATQLRLIYGTDLNDVLESNGIDTLAVSNRVAAGTAYALAQQQPGEMRAEKPLGTETWREQATERTWVQTSARFVQYVTDPYSIVKFTGLAG